MGGSGWTVVDEETALELRSSGTVAATGYMEGSTGLDFFGAKWMDGCVRGGSFSHGFRGDEGIVMDCRGVSGEGGGQLMEEG